MGLRIYLTGRVRIQVGEVGSDDRALGPAQSRRLLAYLVCHRHRPIPRTELAEALWPNGPPRSWDSSLSAAVSRLRTVPELAPLLHGGGGSYQLTGELWVDIEQAMRAVDAAEAARAGGDAATAQGRAAEAAALAREPFLPGEEGNWIDARRTALRGCLTRALTALADAALERHDPAAAVRAATELIEYEPFHETAYRELIRAHVAAGNRAEALRAYESCRKILAAELGIDPSPQTEACYLEALRLGHPFGCPATAGASPLPLPAVLVGRDSGPFVGRHKELACLERTMEIAAGGRIHLALVTGEPGIGKTRLVIEFARAAHRRGAAVLAGRCDEERIMPYRPFVEALRQLFAAQHGDRLRAAAGIWAPDLARLVPELAERIPDLTNRPVAETTTERYRLFEGTAATFAGLSNRALVVLVMDDLHWADRPTLLLLNHLACFAKPAALLILATCRSTESSEGLAALLADLHRDEVVTHLTMESLSEPEVASMLGDRRGLATQVHRLTAGNPLFVRQLVRHLDETGAADLDEAGIPQAVQDVIGRRLSQLDHSTVRALTVAAVIGSRFRLDAVTDAAGLNREEVLAGMEQALTARLLSELPSEVGCFAFVHDLVRKALYDGLSRSRRAVLHRQVAEALETLPQTAASELARHFQAAAAPAVRDKAIRYAIAAAQQAEAQLAHEEAVIHYRAALSALQASGGTHLGERGTLHLALGAAQARAGDPAARESYLRAVNDARADGDSDLFVRAVLGLCAAWGPTPVVDEVRVALVDEALEAVGDEDTAAQARLLARLAAELRFHPDPTRCHRLSAQAVEVARRAGDVATLADCLDAHLAATWGPDGASDRLAGAREIIRLAGPDRERAVAGHAWGIIAACDRCDIDLFDTELAAYRALAEELRQPRYLYYLASRQAMRAILAGDLDEGWRLAEHCREIGQRAGESDVELVSAAIRAPLWIERPDPAAQAAFAQIAAMLRTAAPHAQTCLHSVQVVEIVLALAVGDTQRARTGLADFPAATIHREPKDWKWLFVMANLARAAARLNDMPRAVLLADLLEPYAAQGVHWAGGVAFWGVTAHWLGLLATTLRRWEAAEHHLTRAVEVHDRMGAHPWTARSQYELAQCLFGRCRPGDHSRAATLLKTARRTAATLGLRTLTREITQLATR